MKAIKVALFGAIGAAGVFLLSGCVTYPYQTAFDACDAEAGACYRYCEEAGMEPGDYAACHADCEVGANRCFSDAYERSSYSGYSRSYYAPSWPWYGRYGAWGPSSGYYFGFSYSGGSGDYWRRHRDRHPHGDRRNRDRYDDNRNDDAERRRDKPRRDRPQDGGAYAPPAGSPAANNPRRPRQPPRGQGSGPGQQPAPQAAPPSAPSQSSPPPAASPRQSPPPRSKPPSNRRKGGKTRTIEGRSTD